MATDLPADILVDREDRRGSVGRVRLDGPNFDAEERADIAVEVREIKTELKRGPDNGSVRRKLRGLARMPKGVGASGSVVGDIINSWLTSS
jgi:hypothetical protein